MDAKDPRHPEHLPKVTQIRTESGLPSDSLERLTEARESGRSFLWMGLAGAFAWWIAAFGGAVALLGLDQLSAYSAAVIGAGSVALAIPGLMILMAGLLARENSRAASTNAVVLEAAARLLLPMERTGEDATLFADQMRRSAGEVDRSMAHALSSMKAMSAEISDERQRLESVSYVAADNAKELSKRLHDERKSLETLASDIRKQTEMMSEAIPRQAAQMRDSARAAAADIAQADQALEVRLENLDSASSKLSEKVTSLDTMSVEAAKRSEDLVFAVARMEEKLEQSRKMVEQALRAGEMVAASAHTTGDRLTDAVNSALERARLASRDIQSEALEASERAATSLSQLKQAGRDAAEAVRAARAEADAEARHRAEAEPRPTPPPAEPAPRPIVSEREDRHASWSKPAQRGPSQPKLEDDDVFEDAPAPARETSTSASDEDLFDSGDTKAEAPSAPEEREEPKATSAPADNENEADPSSPAASGGENKPVHFFRRRATDRAPYLKPVGGTHAVNLATAEETDPDEQEEVEAEAETVEAVEDEAETAPEAEPETVAESAPEPQPERRSDSHQWSDIIADMERDEHPTLPREEIAEEVIHRLMDSGIRLGEIFRPRDKKKIANAARKGEGLRRKAISDAASRQVQRVQKRLDIDRQLMHMSREFLAMEEPDALMALDKTCHSSKNASARLSAYLLIDAALG
ncbi:MAG: hypothetical protein RIB03_01980 [Henriciella sp.]|uniref:hypothetical protein n=1 Tax=Henriciella sp. TaxID=1968823 RepID=UPI0032EFB1E3